MSQTLRNQKNCFKQKQLRSLVYMHVTLELEKTEPLAHSHFFHVVMFIK
jgi:hypothetical protein